MPNLLERVKLANAYKVPVRVTEAALLSYGGVQARARAGGAQRAQGAGQDPRSQCGGALAAGS